MNEKKKIFIIDDDPDILELLNYNLTKAGYETIQAASGLGALWEFQGEGLPDLILLDLMMPSPDGYEICRFLKNSSGLQQIPVVIISAKGAKDNIDRVFSLGAEAYLPKPFSIDQLLYVVNRWAH